MTQQISTTATSYVKGHASTGHFPCKSVVDAPWGLARMSHGTKLPFGTFSSYLYNKRGDESLDVYVITGGKRIQAMVHKADLINQ
ncbi:hypothetical protein BC835DRAFT_1421240 [Cytidiella melzeri]|nr:hypothetical protein BC835DRAFT_1421240 [Cytidiella melzeri]